MAQTGATSFVDDWNKGFGQFAVDCPFATDADDPQVQAQADANGLCYFPEASQTQCLRLRVSGSSSDDSGLQKSGQISTA